MVALIVGLLSARNVLVPFHNCHIHLEDTCSPSRKYLAAAGVKAAATMVSVHQDDELVLAPLQSNIMTYNRCVF